ncbi:MAG: hypothetical protein LBK22_02780 [Tannerella sp.]|nr:hypothetical protein [Tannerella sp.]
MKIGKLKKDRQFESRNDRSLGIQTYGEQNDYPQQIMQIVDSSVTGKPCVDVYSKFISGRGFVEKDLYTKIINENGQTADYVVDQIAKDYALFGGFALHVNYNARFQVTEIQHIPFETVRFEKLDDAGSFSRVAMHRDWGRQFTQLRRWKKEDIEYIDLYDPSPDAILSQVTRDGGWQNYKGQVYFYSGQGEKVYPLPVFCNVLTDMNTQEGISNVSNRNARNNFMPAGALIDYNNPDESEEQENETEKSLLEFQGDEVTGNLMLIKARTPEEKPEFISFIGQNYDKAFDSTRKSVREDIGAAFNQPPILRAENVGANFGADLMKNAYNYYNSVTENERLVIERVFTEIFKHWFEATTGNYAIDPLNYTYANQDIKSIPPDILATLTVNEKRALIGFEPIDGGDIPITKTGKV